MRFMRERMKILTPEIFWYQCMEITVKETFLILGSWYEIETDICTQKVT